MNQKRAPKKQSGHTLLEVMFGMFMVVVCAFIFAASMPVANRSRAKADYRNVATSLCEKMGEAIKHNNYPNVDKDRLLTLGLIESTTPVSTNTYSWTNIDSALVDSPATVLPSGTGTMTVQQVDLDLRSVELVVNWSEEGKARSVRLSLLIANL
jgi:Tfp pilus assembly protein PilV